MNAVLRHLHDLADHELLGISEAIDLELQRRLIESDEIPASARQRAISRGQSYRHSTGSAAPPIRAVGLRKVRDQRMA
jgi:hypothetical protein